MSMYVTDEANGLLSEDLRNALWIALDNMKKPTFNQRFELSAVQTDGKIYQRIIHTQKNSPYQKEYRLRIERPVDSITVYIIGFGKHWLMMLQP